MQTSHHGVVRLQEREFTGEMRSLLAVPYVCDTPSMRRLITGDQLVVCPDGLTVALVQTIHPQEERVLHSGFESSICFVKMSSSQRTRILSLGEQHMFVFGHVKDYPPGVWMIAPGISKFLFQINAITSQYRNGSLKVQVGENRNKTDEDILITPWGEWEVGEGAKVELYDDQSMCILEGDKKIGYCVNNKRYRCIVPTELMPGALRLVHWRGRYLLARNAQSRAEFIQIGLQAGKPMRIPLDGQLKHVWSSPSAQAIAFLVRPRGAKGDFHRLFLLGENGLTLVYQGNFSILQRDLFWSASGSTCAARIQIENDTGSFQRIVSLTQNHDLAPGTFAKEVLVADSGAILALVLSDSIWDWICMPHHGSATPVSVAWNLHQDPDGAIVWNTIHCSQVLHWIDRTHLREESKHETTAR